MAEASYISGTASIEQGEVDVVGVGSTWKSSDIRPGDRFVAQGLSIRIESVESNTELTLADPWPGETIEDGSYEILFVDDGVRGIAQLNEIFTKINLTEDYAGQAEQAADRAGQHADDILEILDDIDELKNEVQNVVDNLGAIQADIAGHALSAENAKDAAEDAAFAAEQTKEDVNEAVDLAVSKAAEASGYATAAAGSALSAAGYAEAAQDILDDAEQAKSDAETAALSASSSASDAETAALSASSSASDAADSATAAAQSESAADLHKNAAQQAVADATAQATLAQEHANTAMTKAGEASDSAAAAAQSYTQIQQIAEAFEDGLVTSIVGKTGIVTLQDLEDAGVATTAMVNSVQAYADAKVNDRDWSVYAGELLSTTVALSESSAYELVQNFTNSAVTNAPDWNAPSTTAAPTVSATKAYLSSELAAMVNSAPEALDQLNELAAAMGNDPNFAATMVNELATKQPLDANITSINSRVYTAGQMVFWTADEITDVINTQAYGRSLLNLVDAAAARASIGVYSIGEIDDELMTKADAATTYTKTQVDNAIAAAIAAAVSSGMGGGIPAGAIQAFARRTAPTGWLVADGTVVDVDTYPDLTAAIYCGDANNNTAAFGYRCTNPANPSGTRSVSGPYIMLPDLRGEFIRGIDNGRGKDTGRVFGSSQADEIKSHSHTGSAASAGSHTHSGTAQSAGSHTHSASTGSAGAHSHSMYNASGATTSNTATGGTATRVHSVNNSNSTSTGTAGDHSHSVTVNSAGDHTHTLSIQASGDHSHTLSINSTGGTETRPTNVALLYCIKY